MLRWQSSTNAKDIGIQYIIIGGIGGQLGSGQSQIIRMELSNSGNIYQMGDYTQYNIIITAHGILMIFFMVMPILIGGFGKSQFRKDRSKRNFNNHSFNKIGPYLAGQIEGDGSIIVSKKTKQIRICFNIKDKPLLDTLFTNLNIGKRIKPNKGNYILWEITKYNDQLIMINLINSYFRTPKLEALHRLIDLLNDKKNFNLIKYKLDLSPINSNSWLSGFTDADGNFNVIISPRKNKNLIRIQTQYRLELRQTYHKSLLEEGYGITYWDIMSIIANYLGVNVYNRSRILNNSITYQYYFVASTFKSKEQLIDYFKKYPLNSSKYLDYKDWCKIIELTKNKKLNKDEIIKECKYIKNNMNNSRSIFSWEHLKQLPF